MEEKNNLIKDSDELQVVEKYDSFEEIEDIVTASVFGTIGCCVG